MSRVAIVMGSGKDRPVMQKAADVLAKFEVDHTMQVLSAHKTPEEAFAFARSARDEGYAIIIAGAGKAAHLGGVMAGVSTLPVIGVPLSASLDGMDALLATVQMPTGVPVATVAIDGATNAALLAVQILALNDDRLAGAISAYRRELAEQTLAG